MGVDYQQSSAASRASQPTRTVAPTTTARLGLYVSGSPSNAPTVVVVAPGTSGAPGPGPVRSTPVSVVSTGKSAATTYTEEAYNKNGVPTFADHTNASDPGPTISFQESVQVTCRVYDTSIDSSLPGGYWYKIASPPWSNSYFAVANTFLNGDPPGGPYTHNYDPNVPDC